MTRLDSSRVIGLLRRILRDCEQLYRKAGETMVRQHPTLLNGSPEQFVELMEDLHRGLLVKVYVTMSRADRRWTSGEKQVAASMIEYLWNETFSNEELREAAEGLFQQSDRLSWPALVAPFVRYEPLHNDRAHVETIVMRLANLVVKCDGQSMPEEAQALHQLQRDLEQAIYPKTAPAVAASPAQRSGGQARRPASQAPVDASDELELVADAQLDAAERRRRLDKALGELEKLIGLNHVKERIRSYANFLKLQDQRRAAGLATMPLSLHLAFTGNPGTGKTTVARIIGQILGAMGTLANGHVVETDRSGLVAEYAGQTAVKTNQLCDSALGGVLFVDEAYSLVDASGDDAYGREAIQTLLKRMEDDRSQMVVILAGYSDEMAQMIRSNPGLSSRINTRIEFDDYSPAEMGRIFESMCSDNQYRLPSDARHRLLVGFDSLHRCRDRHFGNGRLVRNTFEESVRRLADRIANVTQLSEQLLTTLTAADVHFAEIKPSQLDQLLTEPHRLRLSCEGCQKRIVIKPTSLGKRVRCRGCGHVQRSDWADTEWAPPPTRPH